MAKPSKISILASKVYAQLRESNEEYTAVELYSMQMILKEELSRNWLFDVLSAADRTVVISPDEKQLYEKSCESLCNMDVVEVHERVVWLEKKITSFRQQEILFQNQRNNSSSSSASDASRDPVTRVLSADSCSRVSDKLLSVMSQTCDKNQSRGSDVDLVTLSREVCSRMTVVPNIVKHLMFHDRDEYLTRLALDSVSRQPDFDAERQGVKCRLLLLEARLGSVEERMCKFLHSIEKRKGCWLREVTRLISEVLNSSCRSKVPAPARVQLASQRTGVLLKEAVRLLDYVMIDSSITNEDELDVHLRLLEQKIRTD